MIDITDNVDEILEKSFEKKDGLCQLFLTHTTAALTTADLDPGAEEDMLDALEKLIPELSYRHPHNPAHMPDHILSLLIGASLTIPIQSGRLLLGSWQRVVLLEFDGPREREVVISFSQ